MNVAVVGHVARQLEAQRLARRVGGRLFLDSGELGEWTNHRRAWLWCAEQPDPWSLVLQDDALPVPNMIDLLTAGLQTLPVEGLVSLYLGTGNPVSWQPRIAAMLSRSNDASWAQSRYLLHGVAVAAPTGWAAAMVEPLWISRPYDEALTMWARARRHPVFYTLPSLVDHADGPTLVNHADGKPRRQRRRAWRCGVPEWNGSTVRL